MSGGRYRIRKGNRAGSKISQSTTFLPAGQSAKREHQKYVSQSVTQIKYAPTAASTSGGRVTSFANNRLLNEGESVDNSISVGLKNSKRALGAMSAQKFAMAAKKAAKVQVKSPLRASSVERQSQNNTLRKSHSSFGRSSTSLAKMYTQDSV